MAVVGASTHQTLTGLSAGKSEMLERAVGLREADLEASGLDSRTFALVKIAARFSTSVCDHSENARLAVATASSTS